MSQTMIRGSKGGSQQHTPTESPDNLRSIAYFRILDLVSEGEIGGLVNGQQSIYLDETPLVNSDGSANFPKAHVESRTGTQDQSAIPGFDAVENEISVGVELKSTAPWVQALSDTTLSAVRVTIGVPALSKANTSNGDITGYTINYQIEVSADGGAYVLAYNGSFKGKTTSKYQRSHRIDLPAATTGWNVRVTRLTANANNSSTADTTTIDSYTEIVDAKLRYPNSALVALMGDASQFSNIPNRAYDLFGRIIQVPGNYNVVTRTYTGTWDGSFKPSWTDNPAWIFYDLVTHPRYGLGHLVDAALVDKWELYKIGQYCDGLVDDGTGGQEPRLTCNVFLQTQADAYKLLNDLSSAFRGISYWANGTIVASADMPSDPVFTYTDANVIGGQFSYSASARKTRFTTALVSWNDPRNFYRTKVEYVEDRDGIARYGIQQTAVTAVGCTSQGQAQRLGRWILLTSRLETDTVTFKVGLDGVLVAPGQIIRVADSARAGKRQGGRIVAATTMSVTLDKAPTVAVGDTITVGMPDGVSQTRTVLTVDGATVTTSTPFTDTPVPQAAWTVESGTLAAQTFRVLAVVEDKSDTEISFTITALQHNASKFDAVDFGTLIQVPPISALTITNQAGPAAVSLESAEVVDPAATTKLLTIAWTSVPGAIAYEAQWRKDDGEWRSLGVLTGLSADIRGAGAGDYVARVRAKGTGKAYSLYSYSNTYTLGAASTLPTTVAGMQEEVLQAQADADTANERIDEISSDNLLTPGEKPPIIRDYNVIITEQAGLDAQASSLGVTTEKTAYDGKVSALTAYLATLTSPTHWDDISGNTTIDGPTFRQKFADVYAARQTMENAGLAAAKAKADAAAVGVPVYNPVFLNDLSGWTFDTAGVGEWVRGTGGSSPDAAQTTFLSHNGVAGQTTTCAHNTGGGIAVKTGQTVTALVALRSIGANASSRAYVRIGWYDNTGAAITNSTQGVTICTPDAGSTYFSQGVSRVYGTAPANAVRALVEIEFDNHFSGSYTATSAWIAHGTQSADEVPESDLRKWAAESGATNGFNKGTNLLRNPTGSASFFGWDGGFIGGVQQTMTTRQDSPYGWAFACSTGGTAVDQGISQLVMSGASIAGQTFTMSGQFFTGHQTSGSHFIEIRQLGSNGVELSGAPRYQIFAPVAVNAWQFLQTTFTAIANCWGFTVIMRNNGAGDGGQARWSQLKLESGSKATPFNYTSMAGDQLGVDGSGHRLGGLRNQIMVGVGNYASAWNGGSISYSASSTSATITAGASTLILGSYSKAYNQASTTVGGSAGATTTYYLYYDDDDYSGGSQTLHATTSQITSLNSNGRLLVGKIIVTFPTSGTGGGTGLPGCPDENAWVLRADPNGLRTDWCVRAREVKVGHFLRLSDGRIGCVTYSKRKASPRVRVADRHGQSLTCSPSAPLELSAGVFGDCIPARGSLMAYVRILCQAPVLAAQIASVDYLPDGYVQHITCENACFWTGDDPDYLFAHHNMKPPN